MITALVAGLADDGSRPGDTEDHIALHTRMMGRIEQEVRRYGGEVQAVFGGTLLAIFGAGRVREDDPERAVRAALTLAAFHDPAGLAVRVGVETGAAVVAPAGPAPSVLGGPGGSRVGGVTGAALDVASSLGVSAAPGSVLVGPAAYRATVRHVDYEPVRPQAWRPLAPRARIGHAVVGVDQAAPLFERDRELTLLERVLVRVREDLQPQLLTLIGAPGIGKTRLVGEFARLVDRDPDLITWRQARSVPYGEGGDGVTLWALTELVRAQAGIQDSDPPDLVDSKLREAVASVIPDGHERAQVEQRLRPLVQVAALPAEADQRRQLVQGWARFVAAIADDRPLVVVVEDIHWADAELLDCLDTLVEEVGPVPLLIVCTARPELLEHRPAWGGGMRNTVTVSLTPLTEQASGALLDVLLDDLGGAEALPAATRARLLAYAGGIPLYLEEYARMLRDRASGAAAPAEAEGDLPLPETVQQIISARLDALPAAERRLLHDMAVLGEVGWRDPLVALTGIAPETVDAGLAHLARRELLRAARSGRGSPTQEFVFRHALVRDVAYGQLLRAERADKHRRVAEWLAATRGGDHAEQIAHHYQQALVLVRAGGQPLEPLLDPARRAFRNAGNRATTLGATTTAIRYYQQALELWPRDDPDRAELLFQLGRARALTSFAGETELVAARDLFEAVGDSARAAEASIQLAFIDTMRGDLARSQEHREHALRLIGGGPPTPTAAHLLASLAGGDVVADRNQEAIRTGRASAQMATELGLPDVAAIAHANIGTARIKIGDLGGLPELDQAIDTLEAANSPVALIFHQARVRALWRCGDLPRTAVAVAAGRRAVVASGSQDYQPLMDVHDALLAHAAGRWDDALGLLEEVLGRSSPPELNTPAALTLRGSIRLDRGDPDGAVADAEAALGLAPPANPDTADPARALLARALAAAGHTDKAAELRDLLLADIRARPKRSWVTTDVAALLLELDRPGDALPPGLVPVSWHHAVRALAEGDSGRAASAYGAIGALPDQALARLHHARQLTAAGEADAAGDELARAVAFWEGVGAVARLRDAGQPPGDRRS